MFPLPTFLIDKVFNEHQTSSFLNCMTEFPSELEIDSTWNVYHDDAEYAYDVFVEKHSTYLHIYINLQGSFPGLEKEMDIQAEFDLVSKTWIRRWYGTFVTKTENDFIVERLGDN
jgi:hypothetical protein